jgi:FKBP-type peptidyl-prolyl cis-trans isomerase (trigger factor)
MLEEKLKENLAAESAVEERRRQERECLDLLAQKSEFDTIPDVLVNQELERMIRELEHSVGENGMELKLQSGSGEPNKKKVGKLTMAQVASIAERKMPDLNANDLEAAKKIVMGTARSMGVEVA